MTGIGSGNLPQQYSGQDRSLLVRPRHALNACFHRKVRVLFWASTRCVYVSAGQPTTNILSRSLVKGTEMYAEEGMISNAIWARLARFLNDMYTARSVHDATRGSMIYYRVNMQATFQDVACTRVLVLIDN